MELGDYPILVGNDLDTPDIAYKKFLWRGGLVWAKNIGSLVQSLEVRQKYPNYINFQSFGEYLHSLSKLCYYAKDLAKTVKYGVRNHRSSIFTWDLIIQEMIINSISDSDDMKIGLFKKASTKKELSQNVESDLKLLRILENPYLRMRYFGRFMDMCIEISQSKKSDSPNIRSQKSEFRKISWSGMVGAYDRLDLKSLSLFTSQNKIPQPPGSRS